jgi:formylglycine-generating enzyme required for sulfatase activity
VAGRLAALEAEYGIRLVTVPGGVFAMGAEGGRPETGPVHQVRISPFHLAAHEVTQALWRKVMGSDPSYFAGKDPHPVDRVSWAAAQEFIARLNTLTGLAFRLPTEAEWEYAAGGPARDRWAGTPDESRLPAHAWLAATSRGRTWPVGSLLPNGFGLFDMTGNVAEWCQDTYAEDYYAASPPVDPPGPPPGSQKVVRGGSWGDLAEFSTVTSRLNANLTTERVHFGFRLAHDAPAPPP